MDCSARIMGSAQIPWRLAERTKRRLQQLGISVSQGISTNKGGLWMLSPGAWPARNEVHWPAWNGPLALVGATLELPSQPGGITAPVESWRETLRAHGGDFQQHIDDSPPPDSLWMNTQAARELESWQVEPMTPHEIVKRGALGGWRIVRHAPIDVFMDHRLRVLEVVTSLQRGGAERLVLDLHRLMNQTDCASRLCALGSPTRNPFPVPEHTLSLARLPFDPESRARGIHDLAIDLGIDIIHGHLLEAATVHWLDSRDWPQVLTIHNQRAGWQGGFDALPHCPSLLMAACSMRVRQEVAEAMPQQPVRTVWNGIDAAALSNRKPASRHQSQATLIAIANPRPQKRLPLLIEVLAELHKKGCNARLLLAGEPSTLNKDSATELALLRARARELDVVESVVELGAVEDVASHLSAADVFVSTSLYEGLSLAQLEALVMGLPVVATDAGGASEVAAKHPAMVVLPVDATIPVFAEAVIASLGRRTDALDASFTAPVMTHRYGWLFHATLSAHARNKLPRRGLLLVTNNFSTGGAQSSARRLLLGLKAAGEHVRAAVIQEQPDHPTPGRAALMDQGIAVQALRPPSQCEAAKALVPLLESMALDPPEAVVFWNVIPEFKLLLVDALWDTPVFEVSPGEMLFASLDRYFASPRAGLPYGNWQAYGTRLSGVIVKYGAELETAQRLGAPVHVISNGVPVGEPMRAQSHGPLVRIGTAARLHPHKRLEDLIEAFKLVLAQGYDAVLHIAGGEEQGLEGYAEDLRQSTNGLPVEWLGDVKDMAPFHLGLDVFAMISEPSGCPNASLEAMAAGLPVVATAVGGAIDQIVDGECGFLTPPRDPQSMAQRLMELIADPCLREHQGRAAWERARQYFSLERMVGDYRRVCLGR